MKAFLVLYCNSLHLSLLLDELILNIVSTSGVGGRGKEKTPPEIKQGNVFLGGRGGLTNTALDFKFLEGRNSFLIICVTSVLRWMSLSLLGGLS